VTTAQLVHHLLHDLIGDARMAKGSTRAHLLRQICQLYKARHTVRLDRFGWPILPGWSR
jgi:hypothetical protein